MVFGLQRPHSKSRQNSYRQHHPSVSDGPTSFDLKYQNEIDNLLNIDELTGLVVKRRFDEELDRFIAVSLTHGAGWQ